MKSYLESSDDVRGGWGGCRDGGRAADPGGAVERLDLNLQETV